MFNVCERLLTLCYLSNAGITTQCKKCIRNTEKTTDGITSSISIICVVFAILKDDASMKITLSSI